MLRIKHNKGSNLVEVIVIIVVIVIAALLILPMLGSTSTCNRSTKCKGNLDQIGKSLKLYTLDFGRGVRYQDKRGQGVLAHIYNTGIL